MSNYNYVTRIIVPAVIAASLVMSGCSSNFNAGSAPKSEIQDIQGQTETKLISRDSLNEEVKTASIAPISEFDSADSTMRIMEQSLFRPSPEVKEEISQTVTEYLTRIGNTNYQNLTGEEGFDFLLSDTRLELKEKIPELVKEYRSNELKYEVKDVKADLVLVTPLGARARVKGTISRTGKEILNISGKPFTAFFYLEKFQDKWYIESAPSLSFLFEMTILSEVEELQIKEVLHHYIYDTLHWDYRTVTGKEGFDYLAPPLFNDKVLDKMAAENVKRYQENEWVQTVNNMMVYFIYGSGDDAHATVAGTLDRSGKTDVQKNNVFEAQYQLKKVDGKWLIANIEKFKG